jgi:hypothetical protein
MGKNEFIQMLNEINKGSEIWVEEIKKTML